MISGPPRSETECLNAAQLATPPTHPAETMTNNILPTYQQSCTNLADIPMTDNGSEISADTDSQSDIQLRSIFLPFST